MLVVFFEGLAFALTLPVLPAYAASLGGGALWAGVLFALVTGPKVVMNPLWGRGSDRWGRRPILALITTGTLIGSVGWALAPTLGGWVGGGLAWLVASRAVGGVFSAQAVLAFAVASDTSGPEKRTAALGLLGAAFGLAFMLGPAIGGYLGARVGLAEVGWACAAAQAASLLAIALLLRETRPDAGDAAEHPLAFQPATLLHLATRPPLLRLLAGVMLTTAAMAILFPVFEPIVDDWYGFDETRAGLALSGFGLVGVVVQGGLIRPLIRRLGEPRVTLLGVAIVAAGFALLAVRPGEAGLWTAIVLLAAGAGFSSPGLAGWMSLDARDVDQGAIHGLNQGATSVGRMIGFILGGALLAYLGDQTPWIAAALLTAAAILPLGLEKAHRAGLRAAAADAA